MRGPNGFTGKILSGLLTAPEVLKNHIAPHRLCAAKQKSTSTSPTSAPFSESKAPISLFPLDIPNLIFLAMVIMAYRQIEDYSAVSGLYRSRWPRNKYNPSRKSLNWKSHKSFPKALPPLQNLFQTLAISRSKLLLPHQTKHCYACIDKYVEHCRGCISMIFHATPPPNLC